MFNGTGAYAGSVRSDRTTQVAHPIVLGAIRGENSSGTNGMGEVREVPDRVKLTFLCETTDHMDMSLHMDAQDGKGFSGAQPNPQVLFCSFRPLSRHRRSLNFRNFAV